MLMRCSVQIRRTSPSFYGHEQLIEYQGAVGWGIARYFSARGETDNLIIQSIGLKLKQTNHNLESSLSG